MKSYADRAIGFEGEDLYCTRGCIFKRHKNGVARLMMTLITEMPVTLHKRLICCFHLAKKSMVLTNASLCTPLHYETPNAVTHCNSPVPPFSEIPLYQNNHLNWGSFPTDLTSHTRLCCARSLPHCCSLSC